MNRFILCLFVLLAGCVASPAHAVKGLWVHPERVIDKATADKTLGQAQRCGVDNLYVLIFNGGNAWFRTPQWHMSPNVKDGFDPLGYCIDAGHKRGMNVHAWFINGKMGTAERDRHPEWQAENAQGGKSAWYDFTKPEVRQFQHDLMLSAVKGYPGLDGIHFDYIRFPNTSLGYGTSSVEAFRKASGYSPDEPAQLDRFPVKILLTANPIHGATTGKVLAAFGTGKPAILENRLGAGRVLFFNWHAEISRLTLLDSFLRSKLKELGAEKRPVKLLVSERNDKGYGGSSRTLAEQWLGRAGAKAVQAKLGECSANDILVVPCIYVWNADEASSLRKLVEGGMNVVWIDGPYVSLPGLLAIIGADRTDDWFSAKTTITPVVEDPAMPVSADTKSVDEADKQAQAWEQWRKDRVTDLVRDVYRSAKRVRPSVIVSAAVFYTKDSADGVLQDWPRWVREGYVDYVIPMAYAGDSALESAFGEWERLPHWRERVIPGLSIYTRTNGVIGPRPADEVRRQVDICAKHGANGMVVFCCHYISPETEVVLKSASGK